MTDVLIVVFLTQDGGIQNGHEHYPKMASFNSPYDSKCRWTKRDEIIEKGHGYAQ